MKRPQSFITIAVTLLILAVLALLGCAKNTNDCEDEGLTPDGIASALCAGVDLPPYEVTRLDETNFEYYTFVPFDDSLSAAAADALVRITPHSLVVIRAENGNGSALAQIVFQNADPNKWVSTCAQTVRVVYTDRYVVLIMSETETADILTENFRALMKSVKSDAPAVLSRDNPRYEA